VQSAYQPIGLPEPASDYREESALRIESGIHKGDLTVSQVQLVTGMVIGNITVVRGGQLELAGMCQGDIVVEAGGSARVAGIVTGKVINRGGTVSSARRQARQTTTYVSETNVLDSQGIRIDLGGGRANTRESGFSFQENSPEEKGEAKRKRSRKRRIAVAAIKTFLVAIASTLGAKFGGWLGGAIAAVIAAALGVAASDLDFSDQSDQHHRT
jgi:hypothetical protein